MVEDGLYLVAGRPGGRTLFVQLSFWPHFNWHGPLPFFLAHFSSKQLLFPVLTNMLSLVRLAV